MYDQPESGRLFSLRRLVGKRPLGAANDGIKHYESGRFFAIAANFEMRPSRLVRISQRGTEGES